MVQSGRFLIPSGQLSLLCLLPPIKMINSVASSYETIGNSYEKESKNMDPKKLKNKAIDDLLVGAGLRK